MADSGIFRINPLQSWQRDAILKAAQLLRDRFGNPPADPRRARTTGCSKCWIRPAHAGCSGTERSDAEGRPDREDGAARPRTARQGSPTANIGPPPGCQNGASRNAGQANAVTASSNRRHILELCICSTAPFHIGGIFSPCSAYSRRSFSVSPSPRPASRSRRPPTAPSKARSRTIRARAARRHRHRHQHRHRRRARRRHQRSGLYRAPLLPLGTYSVVAELQGFKKFEQTGISLSRRADRGRRRRRCRSAPSSETITVSSADCAAARCRAHRHRPHA